MLVFETTRAVRAHLKKNRLQEDNIGFVPTMGALHQGHLTLVQASVEQNAHTVVSIFVNPTQFGPNEDFNRYPRTFEADLEKLKIFGEKVSVFHPLAEEMYPFSATEVKFDLPQLGSVLCGKSRPGHFAGVIQVVSKFFNIIQPDKAYFGAKDFQQTVVIRRMIDELFFPIEMVIIPTIRENDGLAMSSRNRYLSDEERKDSLLIYHSLSWIKSQSKDEELAQRLKDEVHSRFAHQNKLVLDYFEIVSDLDLSDVTNIDEHSYAVIAAYCGKTRLIDNMKLL